MPRGTPWRFCSPRVPLQRTKHNVINQAEKPSSVRVSGHARVPPMPGYWMHSAPTKPTKELHRPRMVARDRRPQEPVPRTRHLGITGFRAKPTKLGRTGEGFRGLPRGRGGQRCEARRERPLPNCQKNNFNPNPKKIGMHPGRDTLRFALIAQPI